MRPLETAVLYLLVGFCVAVAFALRRDSGSGPHWLRVLAAPVFWPLLIPLLLLDTQAKARPGSPASAPTGSSRLTVALAGLNGVADELALPDLARVRAHAGSIAALESRVREMDAMLQTPEFDRAAAERTLTDLAARGVTDTDERTVSVRSRVRNIDRLQALRRRASEDIERVCLQVEEMTAQLKLLRFAGGSSADGEAMRAIRQVADAMESTTDALLAEVPEPGSSASA
jgi:hypothetical protein